MPMIEKTVNFDSQDSQTYFGIVFESLVIGKAEPRTVLIDVPFRNGSLDETDYFGDVRYKDRTITMGFLIPWWSDDQYEIFAKVQNTLNGQRKKITFSADENWYYWGRLTVGDFKIDNGFFKFDITAVCEPYKYQDVSTTYSITSSYATKTIVNDYLKVIPSFNCSVATTLQFGENTYSFSSGQHSDSGIVLQPGNNSIKLKCTSDNSGSVTISYRKGRL